MPLSSAQKLRIKEGTTQRTIHAPGEFAEQLRPLPSNVKISSTAKDYDQLHWFVRNRAELEKELDQTLHLLKEGTVCWIYFPKGSSGMQTDLTRDKGWDSLRQQAQLQWLSLISFNGDWSVFGIRANRSDDRKNRVANRKPVTSSYADPQTKTVTLPEDFASALKKNKKSVAFFEGLSYTNKKEYVEWIVSAKREETRKKRLTAALERIGQGWKNPSNR